MSMFERTPVDVARDDLAAANKRYQRWRTSWFIAVGGATLAALLLIVDSASGVRFWWVYALLGFDLVMCATLAVYDRAWMRRAQQAAGRARRELRWLEKTTEGPQDARPDDDEDWGPYR